MPDVNWLTLFDEASQRHYYFNTVTRKSQWESPANTTREKDGTRVRARSRSGSSRDDGENASSSRKEKTKSKPRKRRSLRRFSDEEAKRKEEMDTFPDAAAGGVAWGAPSADGDRCWGRPHRSRTHSRDVTMLDSPRDRADSSASSSGPFRLRSMSSVDPQFIVNQARRTRVVSRGTLGSSTDDSIISRSSNWSRSSESGLVAGKPMRARANTTNSIYVRSTMAKPDKEIQMRCMAYAVHAHMVNYATHKTSCVSNAKYDVFNDDYVESGKYESRTGSTPRGKRAPNKAILKTRISGSLRGRALHTNARLRRVPSADVIYKFIARVHRKAQMEVETIIVSLVYIERLLKATEGKLCFEKNNWKAICLSAMILASKVWDDLSMWNADFSLICPAYDLKRINHLEIVFLEAFQYNVRVPASTYAKYYFKLRTIRGGLGLEIPEDEAKPIDMEEASKLEIASTRYMTERFAKPGANKEKASKSKASRPTLAVTGSRRRLHSHVDGAPRSWLQQMHDEGSSSFTLRAPAAASLEQLVSMDKPGRLEDEPFF